MSNASKFALPHARSAWAHRRRRPGSVSIVRAVPDHVLITYMDFVTLATRTAAIAFTGVFSYTPPIYSWAGPGFAGINAGNPGLYALQVPDSASATVWWGPILFDGSFPTDPASWVRRQSFCELLSIDVIDWIVPPAHP